MVPILLYMYGGCSERYLDDSLGEWLYLVKIQANEVDGEGGAGAWKKFGPTCSCSPIYMRIGMVWSQYYYTC
jgi:hypothetical protein